MAALTVPTLIASNPVQAADTGTTAGVTAAAVTPASLGLKPVPGLGTRPTTVRLITGQQVQLTGTAGDKPTVIQDPASTLPNADGQFPAQLVIHGETKPGSSTTTITATPTYAQQLVASKAVDPHLFDVTWLAAHGDATGTVPMVVHFAPTMSSSAVAAAAAALPGSTYVGGSVSGHDATVNVNLAAAGMFWSAVTTTPSADPSTPTGRVWYHNPNAPQVLRAGITALTLAGVQPEAHPAAQVTQPAASEPTYQLTLRIHHFTDPARASYFQFLAAIVEGRAGPGIDQGFRQDTATCNAACDTTIVTFNVPAGSYQIRFIAQALHDFNFAGLTYYRPQFDLYADRTLDVWADNANWGTLNTPKPNEPDFGGNYQATYQTADGTTFFDDGTPALLGASQYWLADDKQQPVTAGTFSLATNLLTEQPPVTMSITAPSRSGITLSPSYPWWRYFMGDDPAFAPVNTGWTATYDFPDGAHQYPVVDVGAGTAADFAGRAVAGKLVITRPIYADTPTGPACFINDDALDNAIDAHAVGVLIDATSSDGASNCQPDINYDKLVRDGFHAPAIPWVTLQAAQAQALESLVRQHPVSITVAAASNPTYFYVAGANYERTMPTSVTETLTANHLATENMTINTLQAGQEEAPEFDATMYTPNIGLGIRATWLANKPSLPLHATVYVLTGEDNDEQLSAENFHYVETGGSAVHDSYFFRNVMPAKPNTTTAAYGQEPFTTGAQAIPPEVGALQYSLGYCDVCRQGNDFIPVVDETSGATPDGAVATSLLINGQLTSDGVALPRDSLGLGWNLPPQSATYQLTAQAPNADYSWTFTSSAPAADKTPTGTVCAPGATQSVPFTTPCTPTPLVFVRYIAPVDGGNQAPAGTKQTLTVNAYHAYEQGPAITGLTQQVSFDGGTTWTTAQVSRGKTAGTYTATFTVAPLAQTDGFVSLRTTATDAAGNTTDQTYRDSYPLK
ncbi:MAG: hypothetical protein J2P16_02525 [Mycobacterium sp.]|nr:hypothetical protein [Mycobacterium sp.]